MQTSPYETFQNQIGVRLSYVVADDNIRQDESVALISYDALAKRSRRTPGLKLRTARGAGNEALLSWEALPHEWKKELEARFGRPEETYNALQKHFRSSAKAKVFYDEFQFDNDEYLSPAHKRKYTVNASVLEAVISLRAQRTMQRKSRGGSITGLWDSLASDVAAFQDNLKRMGMVPHTLPSSGKRLKMRVDRFLKEGYASLIDGRSQNNNAQVVTPTMIELWQAIYAGQKGRKPTYIEVALRYQAFLDGDLDIINNETGELFDPANSEYRPASESTIYSYQAAWGQAVVSHSLRSGDRQKFKSTYEPFHKLKQPAFAGSIISIDDRQPPFEYATGKRMWFYNAIDLGSEAFTTWVWGDTKEGIILDFYRQMVRNYTEWGINLPYEMECEMSLNASFKDNLLQNGAMFQQVRIEANNARGKRIEAHYRQLRYQYEKDEIGWLARPFALSESNQKGAAKVPQLPKNEIVKKALKAIEKWNNDLHTNQELHPGMSRWDVFMDKQHPELTTTNWTGILPYIGYETASSMRLGRITLQGKHRVVGFDGEVATGEKLISVMKRIEGKDVVVRWLDGNDGQVLKSLVYDTDGNLICELLGDLAYSRATLERTEEDAKNRELTSAYAATVQGYINQNAKKVESITILEKPKPTKKRFVMPGLDSYEVPETKAEILPPAEEIIPDSQYTKKFNPSTASRF